MQKLVTCLIYADQAEEAVNFYASVLKDVKIGPKKYQTDGQPGSVDSVHAIQFWMFGQEFLAVNGGSYFKFTEAMSIMVRCDSQEEIDYLWEKLSEGGQESHCGWVTDKFGVSWQIVPSNLNEMLLNPDPAKSKRVMDAVLTMEKLNVGEIQRAFEGVAG